MTDYFLAGVPLFANLTIREANEYLAFISTAVGLAFLLWRWRKIHQRHKLTGDTATTPPFPRTKNEKK